MRTDGYASKLKMKQAVSICCCLPFYFTKCVTQVISRLQQIHLVVDDINTQAKQAASTYEATLEPFSPNFDKLVGLYPNEFDRYRLDEIVIAAIAPVVC